MNRAPKVGANPSASDSAAFGLAIRIGLLVLLGYLTLNVIAPFVTVILWSVVLAVAFYPAFEWLAKKLHSPRLSAILITFFCLLVAIGPFTWLGLSLVDAVVVLVRRLDGGTLTIPRPNDAVKSWPLVGEYIHRIWTLFASNMSGAIAEIAPLLKPVGEKFLAILGSLGFGLLEFIASIVIAGLLFIPGPKLVDQLAAFFRRALSQRGEDIVQLAGVTIRNVSRGVVGVALLQSLLGGVGFLVAGIPAAGLLMFLALLLSIVQIGPAVIFIPVTLWSWTILDTIPAIIFTCYMVPLGLLDNVLRPIVMSRGLPIPMPVFFVGMVGGIVAYGISGLFLGPVVISVFWTLLVAWLREEDVPS